MQTLCFPRCVGGGFQGGEVHTPAWGLYARAFLMWKLYVYNVE